MINRKKIDWRLVIAFFLIAISYYDIKYHFAPLKYLGLIILDVMALRDVFETGKMNRKNATVIFVIVCFFVFPVFISGGVSNVINAVIYGLQMGIIIFYSKNILYSPKCYLSIALGGVLSMILAFILDVDVVLSQMAYNYGRVRVCGAFMHPNTLGAVALSVFVSLFVYLALSKDDTGFVDKGVCVVLLGGSIIAAKLSDSNNAMIGMLFFFLLILVNKVIDSFSIPRFVSKLCIFILIILFGYQLVSNFDDQLVDSLSTRITSIEFISEMPISKLLIGYGIVGGGELGIGWGAEFSLTQLIYKTGLMGLLLYFCIFLGWYNRSRAVDSINKNYVECLIVVFLVCSIAEPYITNITNVLPMYFLIIISALSDPNGRDSLEEL